MHQQTSEQQPRLTFIGGGNMGGSLIQGLLQRGYAADRIGLSDPHPPTREHYAQLGLRTAAGASELCGDAEVILLAVKPQIMPQLMPQLAPVINDRQLLISVAAGITVSFMQHYCGPRQPVVRAMPNTPALIGAGITGLHASTAVSPTQRQQADAILSAVGETLWLDDEAHMDAVTAVSGSGPAYFFLLVEALTAAGVAQGLESAAAARLALSTGYGAMSMARQSDVDAAELRRRVTSPGGTTAAALQLLENRGLREMMREAVAAATRRGGELAAAAENQITE
ncbi:MAG: pyrroline-5-carboxylate reductase [Wenzhouxiangellaceae bacterium]